MWGEGKRTVVDRQEIRSPNGRRGVLRKEQGEGYGGFPTEKGVSGEQRIPRTGKPTDRRGTVNRVTFVPGQIERVVT